MVSNDSDAILYTLLAASQWNRENNKFCTEFWLEVVHISNSTSICGVKNKKVSEYSDINKLIYAIEEKLPSITNPVLSLIVLYLCAVSDLTEKWFGITHTTF